MHAVDAFFRDLIERRYYAATRSGGLVPSAGPASQVLMTFSLPSLTGMELFLCDRVTIGKCLKHLDGCEGAFSPRMA